MYSPSVLAAMNADVARKALHDHKRIPALPIECDRPEMIAALKKMPNMGTLNACEVKGYELVAPPKDTPHVYGEGLIFVALTDENGDGGPSMSLRALADVVLFMQTTHDHLLYAALVECGAFQGHVAILKRTGLFKVLSPTEVASFRAWADENFDPATPPSPLWHPVTRRRWTELLERR